MSTQRNSGWHARLRWSSRGIPVIAVAGLLALTACSAAPGPGQASGHPTGRAPARVVAPVAVAPAAVSITPSGPAASGMGPATPIVVTARGGRLTGVTITNVATGVRVAGAYGAGQTSWTSTEPLGYGARYGVLATGVNQTGRTTSQQATLNTLTPARQASATVTPAPSIVDATGVGIAQPVVVQFSHPVTDKAAVQQHLQVTTNPPQPGAWYWTDDENAHFRPQNFWTPGTTITVNAHVYGTDLGAGTYGAADINATYRVHDSWVAQANGDTDQMTILHNGAPVKTMPISMGKGSTPTHSGIHVISDKQQTVDMNSCTFGICSGPQAYNVTEYWAERISNDGEFVHENPDSVSDQGSTNVSHGCINLNQSNAEWFFQHLGYGDPVIVTGSGGPPLPVWDRYGDWSLPWPQWQAGNPSS